jgi:hypothetical protein
MRLGADELLAAIAAGEGKCTEFKRGLPSGDKLARTLAAFANTRGGLLLIGVGDRGEIVGAPRPRETMREVREIARACIEPALQIDLSVVRIGERTIVACSVPVSRERPHSTPRRDGSREVVVRAGSSNRAADGATAKALRARRGSEADLPELERRILEWVRSRSGGPATVAAFCEARNIGKQRARRAFVELERSGLLVGHGPAPRRLYDGV